MHFKSVIDQASGSDVACAISAHEAIKLENIEDGVVMVDILIARSGSVIGPQIHF